MYYYWVDAVTGEIKGAFYGAAPTPPDGMVIVNSDMTDLRMSWDFVTSSWYWGKKGLKAVLLEKYQYAINSAMLTIGPDQTLLNSSHVLALYLTAIAEDPAATRPVTLDGKTWTTYTNADVANMVYAAFDDTQRMQTVTQQIFQDIDSGVVTAPAGIDAAWVSYSASYVSTRTKLPSYSSLVADVQELQTAVAALQQP